jgi:hypothetical protein
MSGLIVPLVPAFSAAAFVPSGLEEGIVCVVQSEQERTLVNFVNCGQSGTFHAMWLSEKPFCFTA